MKKILTILILALLPLAVSAQEIRSVDVTVDVRNDGSATITTDWDVTVVKGTEWYIPVGNLGKMEVKSLTVYEKGRRFTDEGFKWDSDRSLAEKTWRSGIIKKGDGVELCWGQGAYGDHQWRSIVEVTGLVQSLKDYDAFNYMFVNPNMVAAPKRARVVIRNQSGGAAWTSDNTKVWAFGFAGEINVRNGEIVAETSRSMSKSNSVIVMARFDKGMMSPSISRSIPFSKMESKAKKGSDYGKGDKKNSASPKVILLLLALLGGGGFLGVNYAKGDKYKKKLFGTRKIDGWWRDTPVGGNLFWAFYVLEHSMRFDMLSSSSAQNLFSAFFLKWVLEQKMTPMQDPRHPKRYNLAMRTDVGFEDRTEMALYEMALAAAGDNLILESKEFERWSKRNFGEIEAWPRRADTRGRRYLISKGLMTEKNAGTEKGYEEMKHVIQYKKFLKDFTINNERTVPEVHLWSDYLIFSALYGIADKVTEQLKKLYPVDFAKYAEQLNMDQDRLLYSLAACRTIPVQAYSAASAEAHRDSGGGGSSSIGGGGGFSGGGSGGGSR